MKFFIRFSFLLFICFVFNPFNLYAEETCIRCPKTLEEVLNYPNFIEVIRRDAQYYYFCQDSSIRCHYSKQKKLSIEIIYEDNSGKTASMIFYDEDGIPKERILRIKDGEFVHE